jgi:hypothetical protein
MMKAEFQQFLLLDVDTIKVANIILAFQNTLEKKLLRIWLLTVIIAVQVISHSIICLLLSVPFNSFLCNCTAHTTPTNIISKL